MNRFHAHRASLARPVAGFALQPEPRSIGCPERGRQLCAGTWVLAGHMVQASGRMIWDIMPPALAFEAELHGFGWLDDLAAVGDSLARDCARRWMREWVHRHRRGRGSGWIPVLTGRRLIRWTSHARFLLQGQGSEPFAACFLSLAQQTVFLGHRWRATAPGLPRFEALVGLVHAGLALAGMQAFAEPAIKALCAECRTRIDADGGIVTRNPEELLEIFALLNWTAAVLSQAGGRAPQELLDAIARIAPVLRVLRHADGGLARFHGGGRGAEGRLDSGLAISGVRIRSRRGAAMGFARLCGARTTVVVDAAVPPAGVASHAAHASTLAFELTSGRRPLIVNCGAGLPSGEGRCHAGRATSAHSTLSIDGMSSSGFGGGASGLPIRLPRDVRRSSHTNRGGTLLTVSHDGYAATHGLIHTRRLELAANGRGVAGEDVLAAAGSAGRKQFDQLIDRRALGGIPFHIRFHLHPKVRADINMNGTAVSLVLESGEIWVFRHDGMASLTLVPSVYLEKGWQHPTQQILLSHRARGHATRLCWTLAKATDTPMHIRDTARDDPLPDTGSKDCLR